MNDLSKLPSLKETIDAHGLSTRKSLGQHFLLNSAITDNIVRYAGDVKDMHVIEVGPGPGGLTRSLLNAGAKQVIVIEKDERCIAIMEEIKAIVGDRLVIMNEDALKVDVMSIPAPRKIVANLPYNVGTMMLVNWLDAVYRDPTSITSMTLMFQKEVGERIMAAHGNKDYGRLSVLCQWLCDCRFEFELPPGAFSPPPKVNSVVVTLTPRTTPLVDVKKEILEQVVAKAFNQRRKMLRAALKGLEIPADQLLEASGLDGTLRAEQVDVMTLCNLAKVYQKLDSRHRVHDGN